MERLRQLIHEVHRRSLWQVLAIYAVASWAVLQVVDTVAGALQLPDWLEPVALVLLIVGLPIVLATAFVQEGGPRRDATHDVEVAETRAPASRLFTWRNALGGGVLAFALWGVVAAGWVLFGGGTRDTGGDGSDIEPSIAVLPCDDLSPNQDQAALAQGVAEEVSLALSGLEGVEKVSGRSSTVTLKSQGADLATIASTLGVANVLNCTVARSGDQVRVTAELTEAATDAVLWSDRFQEQLTDLFAMYDVIARGVADGLRLALAGDAGVPLVPEATESAPAHEAYLRGRYLLEQRTEESLVGAIAEFEQAIELDADYAEAYAGLADAHILYASYDWAPDYRAAIDTGIAAARRAIQIAPESSAEAMAQASLGFALWNVGDWGRSEAAFKQALRLSPQFAQAHQWYGFLLSVTGRADEGVSHAERAVELDPVFRQGYRNLAGVLWVAGRTEDALDRGEDMLALAGDWPVGWSSQAQFLLELGRYEEGMQAVLTAERLVGGDVDAVGKGWRAMARYGQTGEPQTVTEAMVPYNWQPAVLYANVGKFDRALELIASDLERGRIGFTAHSHAVGMLRPLEGDPRYRALIEGAGITW